ncbi:MAG: hypothetical protein HOP15_14025 [Planctomycetes bacterium]|nr:hypothetical protein [Planctomycetota bacterium]
MLRVRRPDGDGCPFRVRKVEARHAQGAELVSPEAGFERDPIQHGARPPVEAVVHRPALRDVEKVAHFIGGQRAALVAPINLGVAALETAQRVLGDDARAPRPARESLGGRQQPVGARNGHSTRAHLRERARHVGRLDVAPVRRAGCVEHAARQRNGRACVQCGIAARTQGLMEAVE